MTLTRNVGFVLGSALLPLVINVVTVPLYIRLIGADRYGALLIAWVLLGYFGQVDFGIGRAITQRLAVIDQADRPLMAKAVWSALASAAVFSSLAGAALYIAGDYFFGQAFRVDESLRGELLDALWMLALCTPVVAIGGVLSGSLQGLNRFGLSSAGVLVGNLALQVLPLLVAVSLNKRLDWLIGASLAARVVGMSIPAVGVWLTILRKQGVQTSREELSKLAKFGSWIMVSALIGPLMISSDRFVIGAVAGAAAVAAYSIPFQIAARTTILPISLSQALFPRFASSEHDVSRRQCEDASIFVGQVYAPICIGLACLASPLLHLWLGNTLDTRSILIGQIVLAGFWANAVANVPYAFIQARGNPRFTAILHTFELPVYVALLFGLGYAWGLAGFAAAYAVRCLLDCIALLAKAGVAKAVVVQSLLGSGVLVLLSIVAGQVFQDWISALSAGVFLGAASAAFAWFQMPPAVRAQLGNLPIIGRLVPVI